MSGTTDSEPLQGVCETSQNAPPRWRACTHDDLAVVDECPTCVHCGVIVPCEGCGKRPDAEPMYLIHASDDRLKAWLCEPCEEATSDA